MHISESERKHEAATQTMLIMTSTKKIFKTLLLLAGSGTALATLEDAQQVTAAADAAAAALAEVVETNKAVEDGEVLAARQTVTAKDIDEVPNLVKPNNKIEIHGTGSIQIGDENTTGVLEITRASKAIENTSPSISQASISVTAGNGVTNVHVGPVDTNGAVASITNVQLNLEGLKSDVFFVVDDATISASQIYQTSGSIHLVNHAGMSLIEPSHLHNLYVDSTSSFHASAVSTEVLVDGSSTVEFDPRDTGSSVGVEQKPLVAGQTISSYQLYGLTFDTEADLSLDLSHVFVSDEFKADEGYFYIRLFGVRWMPLEQEGVEDITDIDFLADCFKLYNFGTANGEDISDRLVIMGGYYGDATQGLQLAVQLLPESGNVPEPATATLSLLALAGMAARRRRK
mgnify:CR=1 FL=1